MIYISADKFFIVGKPLTVFLVDEETYFIGQS